MAKALPVMGILGAFLAAGVAAVLVETGILLVVPVMLAASVVLLGQRSILGAVAGLLVLLLTVLAALGILGNVSTKNAGDTDFGIGEANGAVLALAACLAVPAAATLVRWNDPRLPRWLAGGGLACAAIALLVGLYDPAGLKDHGGVRALVHAILCLLVLGPMIPLMSGDPPEELPPLAVADAPTKPATPKAPGKP